MSNPNKSEKNRGYQKGSEQQSQPQQNQNQNQSSNSSKGHQSNNYNNENNSDNNNRNQQGRKRGRFNPRPNGGQVKKPFVPLGPKGVSQSKTQTYLQYRHIRIGEVPKDPENTKLPDGVYRVSTRQKFPITKQIFNYSQQYAKDNEDKQSCKIELCAIGFAINHALQILQSYISTGNTVGESTIQLETIILKFRAEPLVKDLVPYEYESVSGKVTISFQISLNNNAEQNAIVKELKTIHNTTYPSRNRHYNNINAPNSNSYQQGRPYNSQSRKSNHRNNQNYKGKKDRDNRRYKRDQRPDNSNRDKKRGYNTLDNNGQQRDNQNELQGYDNNNERNNRTKHNQRSNDNDQHRNNNNQNQQNNDNNNGRNKTKSQYRTNNSQQPQENQQEIQGEDNNNRGNRTRQAPHKQ